MKILKRYSMDNYANGKPFMAEDSLGNWVKFSDIKGAGARPKAHTQMLPASQINHALKSLESDKQRLEFLSNAFAGICRNCGKVTDVCYCMCDD